MVTPEQARAHNLKTINSGEAVSELQAETVARLKQLLPHAVSGDNQLNLQHLREALGLIEAGDKEDLGYELTFAGKGVARALANTVTKQELQTEPTQSKNFDATENVVIRGDNLEALKLLQQNYYGKIKMIYIDPPYNTQSETFLYQDNFKINAPELCEKLGYDEDQLNSLIDLYGMQNHSGWLAMMYPRLKLARSLLTEDGVIFISIDDNEQTNLKILCDEIFGGENFVANLVWESNKNIMKGSRHVRKDHEYVLFYRKSVDLESIRLENGDIEFQNCDNDPKGDWLNTNATLTSGGNYFGIDLPNGGKCFRNWRFTESEYRAGTVPLYLKNGNVPRLKIYKSDYDLNRKTPSSLVKDLATTTTGKNKLASIFNCEPKNVPFDNPKDASLINYLIKFAADKDPIILDFFAGSGTTGDAVMQLNAEDGGRRKFILVQWDETIAEGTDAHQFCIDNKLAPVISSITIERLNRAGEKIKPEEQGKNGDMLRQSEALDIGYKVFSLKDKIRLNEDGVQATAFTVVNERRRRFDTLWNLVAASCVPLHQKVTEIEKDLLYQAGNRIYVLGACQKSLADYADHEIYVDGYADLNLQEFLNLIGTDHENLRVVY